MKDMNFIFNDTIDEVSTITYFTLDLFKNLPLEFDKFRDGWFNYKNEGELNFRFFDTKKVNETYSYVLYFNIKPKDLSTFKISNNPNLKLDDFISGMVIHEDDIEHANIRLHKIILQPKGSNNKEKEMQFELVLK